MFFTSPLKTTQSKIRNMFFVYPIRHVKVSSMVLQLQTQTIWQVGTLLRIKESYLNMKSV